MMVRPKEQAFTPAFLEFVSRLIAAEVPVVLAVPGPKGHFPAGAFLNDVLKEAVKNHDLGAVEAILSAALNGLATHRFNPVKHRYGPVS
jgi:hypothetical protein